jgi:hypothetical protein
VRPPVPRLGVPRHGCSRGSMALMPIVPISPASVAEPPVW